MNGSELDYINKAFEENWIAPAGPNLNGFESEMSEYLGISSAVALASGTAAIHLCLRYIGIEKGDTVFCSDFTFSGSCNPIVYEGATPVFIDSEPVGFNMSHIALQKAFDAAEKKGKMPKAVVIVDLYGQSADYDKLLPICEKYGVPVIEDAAEALGAEYDGKKCGSFGKLAILSFNGNKIITTSGGGMAVSNDPEAIKKIYFWANQSKEAVNYYLHRELGFNYRMSNICAGIGRGQLKTLDEKIVRRKEIYDFYKQSFADLPVTMAPTIDKSKPNYWLSVLTINPGCAVTPAEVVAAMEAENIETRRAWNPMHSQPFYGDSEYFTAEDGVSVSQEIFDRGVCMPSGSAMTQEDLDRISDVFRRCF